MNTSPLNFPINKPPTNGATGPNISGAFINAPIPPLDKSRFESSYKQWCLTKAIVHDPRLLAIDNRQIDLFQLHCLVMREGGLTNVSSSLYICVWSIYLRVKGHTQRVVASSSWTFGNG